MDLRSAALFIFLCCLALRGARSLKVQLTPDKASLVEGGELVMNCTVDTGGAMSFTWVKDDVRILQNALKYLNRVSLRHQTIGKKQVSLLRIAKLTECDSGTYYCNVDRMGNIEKSKGTNVIVTRASQISSCQPINIIFIGVSAGVAAALVIALIIVSLRLRRSIKDCHGLQRQFIKYIAEKSTDFMITEEQKKHKPNQERRKKKNKSPQSNRVENMQRGNVQ